MKRIIALFVLCSMIYSFLIGISGGYVNAQSEAKFYVSPTGFENGDGSFENPFSSLATAIEKIKNIQLPVTIYMRGGTYYMDRPLILTNSNVRTPLTIQAYQNEKPIISGGRQLAGWQYERDGIYRAYVPEYDFIRTMTVNGISAQRANSNKKLFIQGVYGERLFKQGYVVNRKDLPTYFNGKNAEVVFLQHWQEFRLKIDRAEPDKTDDTKMILYFKTPLTPKVHYSFANFCNGDRGFQIENDLSLLDKEREFYFDEKLKYLYYKPSVNENMQEAIVNISKEEYLIKVQGEHLGNKVSNITFDGLTFANTAWKKAEKEGFISEQASKYNDLSIENDKNAVHSTMVPAAVQVTAAEYITFKNNKFCNIDKVALGLYEGVSNSVIEGNAFSDISNAAITVGLTSHIDNTKNEKTDVAYKKPTTAGTNYLKFIPQNATDGDPITFWSSNGGINNCHLTVDLEKEYKISDIVLKGRGDPNYNVAQARKNFEIQASNECDFRVYDILGIQRDQDFGITNTWTCSVNSEKKYRYVRFKKNVDALAELSLFKVYTTDLYGIPEKEVCKNNKIANNFITRTGIVYYSSAAIQAFYTENLEISNNHIKDVPYSGITIGWGWGAKNDTAKNNRIMNNRFENVMQRLHDGGAVYILGNQPNLIIDGNYIKNARYGPGGIYPDDGTRGTIATPINIINNVFEDTSIWAMIWRDSIKFINVSGNYTTDVYFQNNGSYTNFSSNTMFVKGNPPTGAAQIINNAGLLEIYNDLYNQTPSLVETEDNAGMYIDYGPHAYKDKSLDIAAIKRFYLMNVTMTGNWYYQLLEGIDNTQNEVYAEFKTALIEAIYQYKNGTNYDNVVYARVNLLNAINRLIKSNIFQGFKESPTISTDFINSITP